MSSQYPGSLHNHSQFSNLRLRDSINRTAEMMEYAIELGHTTLGITEHETISNAIKIEKEYKKIKEKHPEFKLIRGNEIYLCRDGLTGQNFERGKDRYFHFILLARDSIGHQQIRELSTRAWNRSWMNGKMRRVPTYYQDLIDIIGAAPGHVIGSTACLGGFLDTKLLQWVREGRNDQFYQQIINWVKQMEGIFGKDHFYLEMQPSANDEQECANRELFNLSEITGIPYIITTDSHYLKKEDAPIHKAFLNSQEGDREVDSFYATTYMMSTEELESYMAPHFTSAQLATAYSNIEKIRDMCEDYSLLKPLKIPSLPWGEIPQISQLEYDYWIKRIPYLQKFLTSTFDGDRAMAALVVDKLKSDKRLQYQDCYKDLNENLEMTWVSSEKNNTHWSAYFLNLRGILDTCWEAGSIVGPGRGSGVGFTLLYMLDLIQINPLWETTKTFSWRFLNPDRVSVLDIDTDIEGGKRAQVLQALRNKYGQDRVANVVTFGTEASKSAIQTACFEPDVLVNTVDGLKEINKLKKGDRIYTSNGIEEILETTSRDFSGDIYEIHNDFNINPIHCTENHQFLIYPQGRVKQTFGNSICNYNRCQLFDPQNNFIKEFISNTEACRYYADVYKGSFSSMKRNKRHNGYYIKNIETNEIKNSEIQWLTANKIQKTDKLLSYIDLSISKEFPLINFPKEEQNPYKKYCNYIKEQILIDNELCELLGIYLAEGNINAEFRGITFTINQKEEEFAERIIYLLQHCFGISKTNISILNKKDSLGLSIQVNSTPLGNFIWRYFNDNQKRLANNKQIPNKFKFLPPEKQLYIVKGFYLGDGYSRKRNNGSFETKLTTISPQLALDLWQILARNKCKSTCISENRQKNNENKSYNIMIYGINSELLYNIKYLQQIEQPIEIKEKTEYLCYENKYYYTSNILSIEKIKENIQEKVYCLSVPSQHFVLNNIITHNCRGLGIDVDTALYIASLVPADRGIQRTLKQCYYGDDEYAAIPLFIQQMNMYPELWEVAQKIEGLISRVGEHAGGVIFVDEPFTNSTALMKVPNGDTVTQFDLHDCEDASLIKIDLLSVEALDKIHVCLDLLSDQGYIERENTLRETYEKYLGIYNIEREDPSMWNMVWNHEILSLFQMEKQSGIQGIALTHPSSVDDLCVLNSVNTIAA